MSAPFGAKNVSGVRETPGDEDDDVDRYAPIWQI